MTDIPATPNSKPPGADDVIEATPQREAATPATFKVGDIVRFIGEHFQFKDEERIVRRVDVTEDNLNEQGVIEEAVMLVVWKDEAAGRKIPEWKWYPHQCELVEAAPLPVEQPAAIPADFVIAPEADADPARTISAMFEKLQNDFAPPAPVVNLDATYSASYVAALRAEKEEAVALAAQELQRANALENRVLQLQSLVTHPQPVPVQQSAECFEMKTLVQDLDNIIEADLLLTQHYNDGWHKEHIGVTSYVDGFTDHPRAVHMRIVTLKKRTAPTQPQRPQREASASASSAGQLTGQFVVEQMRRDEQPINSYGALIKAHGVEGAMQMLDGHAFDNAMARHRQRVTTHPIPQRSLLSLKAGQS